ncbi:MAG: branched-chain amino acid ABC transporter substrate-binding protein [Candidatus Rokuibacteriota bacterium]|nr:MAG: branched-chain amino acid ABC transporter substrate-binding protein [Candidatus Rokubacteria bacterium]
MMRRVWRLAAPVAIGIAAGLAPASAGAGDVLRIGAPLAATGAEAREGALAKQGYDLWAETVNARGGLKVGAKSYRVEIIYYDDQSKPQISAELTDRLISQDHVSFLLGPYGSPATFADAAVAEKYRVPMVEANGAARKIFAQGYRYVFGVLSPADEYAASMLRAAATLVPRPQAVAILAADDLFSLEVANGARDWAEKNGLRVVYFQKYPVGVADLSAPLTRIKSLRPDILLGSGHLQESLLIMKQAQTLDVTVGLYAFTVGPTTPDFVTALGPAAEGVFASSQWTPDVKYRGPVFDTAAAYAKAFERKYGFVPDYHAAESSAAGVVLQLAVEKAQSVDPATVREALASLDVMTFYGPVRFNAQGLNDRKPMVTVQIQQGRVLTVWPRDVAAAKAIYPTPPWSARK